MRRYALALSLALAGCPDDPKPAADTSQPADTADAADTADTFEGDAPDSAEPDALPDTDTSPGRTIAGTSLEGVTITWDTPMSLCSTWQEGAPLADEKARKVIIDLPAQTRSTLDEDQLAVPLQGLKLRTSPFANGLFQPEPAAEQTRVTDWSVFAGGTGGHILTTTVEHTLAGKAGTLVLTYTVGRAPGESAPVVVTPESYELTFAWRPFGSDLQPTRLTRCGGDPALEDAVSVVTGFDGDDWITVIRFWRTIPAFAGSYPVHLTGHRILTSDRPWWPTEVRGFWSHTYVAEHHNWADATEVDLAGDRGHWHHTLPFADGAETLAKVTLEGTAAIEAAAIHVEYLSDDGPRLRTFARTQAEELIRVDATHLARHYAARCAGQLSISVAGGYDHLAQAVFCDEDAILLVPVAWSSNPALSGQAFEPTRSGDGQWSFDIDKRGVTLKTQPDDQLELSIYDAEGELLAQSREPRGPLHQPAPWRMPVEATGEANGEPIHLEIGREWVTFGVGKSQIWAPTHLTVSWGERRWHVESWDRLNYTNTHHNWEDELIAEADDGTSLRWKTSFMGDKPNLLTITAADGTPLLPETLLP